MMNQSNLKIWGAVNVSRRSILVFFAAAISLAIKGSSKTYYILPKGCDCQKRDGRSWKRAWKTLAYACDNVPAGSHIIQLGPGKFVEKRTAYPKSGITIRGVGIDPNSGSQIIADNGWPLSKWRKLKAPKKQHPEEYLIALRKSRNVKIQNLCLSSFNEEKAITGAIFCASSKNIEISELDIQSFRWNALYLVFSEALNVHHCEIKNSNLQKFGRWNGQIRTRWVKKSEFHHNKILSTVGGSYGYKGGGHDGVRIHHNVIEVNGAFGIESPHESEYGVEIDHNTINRCISIPKGGPGKDPNHRGYSYSFWIHDNLLTNAYAIEGPRNHLRLSHNYIRIERPNGRVYTHHGGINHGPIWIHHNVIENVDRSLIWMNKGLAENIYVYNNTVYFANAGSRADAVFGVYQRNRLNNWVVKNNILVAHPNQSRRFLPEREGVNAKVLALDNLCINIVEVPKGNTINQNPQLLRKGLKPWPFFSPASPTSFVVDQGVPVGLPFSGKKPDIGAYEYDTSRPFKPVQLN